MSGLKEISIAIARIILGIVVLVEGLIVLDLIVYIGATGSTFTEKVMAAFDDGYSKGYVQTYDVGYQEAYGEAYDKGFGKGFEVGQETGSKEGVATRVELHNPTYSELQEFLARDKTDSNEFITGEYVCFDFAAELNNNAEANGIRAAYVRIRSKEWAHAVVVFETVDMGLVFIEPQSDRNVELVIGKPYPWWQVGAHSPMGYNDAIVGIQIIW